MAFTPQTDAGTVAGANAYGSVAGFKAHHTDRGNSYAAFTDPQIEVGIVKGTDYLDHRWSYVGRKRNGRSQTTLWPRSEAYDADDDLVTGIPHEILEATYEYAFRALSAELLPDPVRTGDAQALRIRSEKVGPIARTLHYVAGSYVAPMYPEVDLILIKSGLILTQDRDLVRA